MRGDDVELALHQHRVAAAGDLVTCEIEPEDDASLHVGRRLGRVDVLALLVGTHGPGGEGERLAALVADGNDQALGEKVGSITAQETSALRVGQRAFLGSQILGEAPACGGVAELEAARRLFSHLPRAQQPATGLPGRGRPKHVLVVLGSQLEHRQQAPASIGALLLLGSQLLELDAGPLGEQLKGAALVRLLNELHEGEDIARAFAAEAVPGLHLRVDLEAGAVLLVEWAKTPEVLVALGEANMFRDDLDQVELGLDLGEGVIGGWLGHTSLLSDAPASAESHRGSPRGSPGPGSLSGDVPPQARFVRPTWSTPSPR